MYITFSNPKPDAAFSRDWFHLLRSAFGPRNKPPRVAETANQLLARAQAYASTQPGYAADLRAAAQRMIEVG